MFGRQKLNYVAAPFFARIEQSDLALDDAVIQEIAERSGVNENWPNVSLAGLQAFATALVSDVVRAGGHDIRLGNMVYFTKNENGSVSPTGLSWENAILNAGFENIVVSTAEHIFNDTEIRQEEDMTYAIINEALQPLMDAVIADGTLARDDLPVLPTEEEFRQARETGEVLTVEPNKFQRSKPESVTPVVEAIEATNDDQPLTETDSSFSLKAPITDSFSQESHRPPIENSAADNLFEAPTEPNTVPMASEDDSIQRLIDRVNLAPKSFEITDVSPVLPAEDPNYVFSRLNADKAKANDFLNDTSLLYTQKVRQALSEYLKQEQGKLADEITTLQQTDVMSSVAAQLAGERPEEFETRYDMRKKAREAGYQANLSEENQRHEQSVSALKVNYVKDLEELKVSINQELDDWYLKRTQTMKQSVESSLVNQINDKQTQAKESFITGLKALRDELLANHSHSMIALQEQLSQDIENKRQTYKQEHDDAMLQATKLASAQAQSAHLGELQDQINALESNNRELTHALKAQAQKSEQALSELYAENQSLQASSSKLKQLADLNQTANQASNDQVNQQLVNLLTAQLKANQAVQKVTDTNATKRRGALSAFAIGSLVALLMGGTALGAYTYGHHEATAKTSSQRSSAGHKQASIVLGETSNPTDQSSNQSSSSSAQSSDQVSSSSESSSQVVNPLSERYHVGENVSVTINGQNVTAQVSAIENQAIMLT